MAKKIPPVTARRPAPVPESVALELENAAEHRQRLPAGSVQTFERPHAYAPGTERLHVPTFERLDASDDGRLVERKGRVRGDGSRSPASQRLRLTVYLDPTIGRRLDVFAASHGRERSQVIGEALAAWLEAHAGE